MRFPCAVRRNGSRTGWQAWKDVAKAGHVGTMVLKGAGIDVLRVVAEAVL